MKSLVAFVRSLVGLFVDDWRVTATILAWFAFIALALPKVVSSLEARAVLLFAGLAAILIASVALAARQNSQ